MLPDDIGLTDHLVSGWPAAWSCLLYLLLGDAERPGPGSGWKSWRSRQACGRCASSFADSGAGPIACRPTAATGDNSAQPVDEPPHPRTGEEAGPAAADDAGRALHARRGGRVRRASRLVLLVGPAVLGFVAGTHGILAR